MSRYMIEKVLFDVNENPGRAQAFREDPDSFLGGYRLEADERQMLKRLDVRAMADRQVSTLLLMMAWMIVRGPGETPAYMAKMNGQ